MKAPFSGLALLVVCWLLISIFSSLALAEDWKTSDGKTYSRVTVVKVEDDAVTILYADGGARVSLATLPPDLQHKFHYDPAKALAAASRYEAEQKASEQQLAVEKNQQEATKKAQEAVAQQQKNAQQIMQAKQQAEQATQDALAKVRAVAVSGAAHFRCKVIQIIPSKAGDALLAANYGPENYPLTNIIVVGLDGQHADGDWVSCWGVKDVWYYAGIYQYTSVTGATLTCRVYSPNLDWAVQNLSSQSR